MRVKPLWRFYRFYRLCREEVTWLVEDGPFAQAFPLEDEWETAVHLDMATRVQKSARIYHFPNLPRKFGKNKFLKMRELLGPHQMVVK